jgi:Ferredoxin-thioredoxin reductase, catalytic subunit
MKIIENPDKEYAKEVRDKLKKNNGYCPCRIVKDENTKCMCKEFRESVKSGKAGTCHCGLYIAVDTDGTKGGAK